MTNSETAWFERLKNLMIERASLDEDIAELKTEAEKGDLALSKERIGDLVFAARRAVMDQRKREKMDVRDKRRDQLLLDLGV